MGALRVVHVITKLELGGAQQNTLYTVSHLNRSIFDVHLITGAGGMLDDEARRLPDVTVHFCPDLIRQVRPVRDRCAYRNLRSLFDQLKPDIVHTHSSKAGMLGRAAAFAAKVPSIIHTYHGFGFHQFQNPVIFRLYLAAERRACRQASHLVFVSNDNWRWASQLRLLDGKSASLIRSGILVGQFSEAKKAEAFHAELGIPARARAIGMIACLKPQKDPLTFVEIADIVTQKMDDVYFILIGDGDLRAEVFKRAGAMKYPSRFLAAGWRRDIPEILANLDLLILTSLWEGLPRVIPEATLARVPAIASNIDGNREVVFEGRNGALAEPRNANDFAGKIIRAIGEDWKVDPQLAQEMSHEFDIDLMVRKQEELYLKHASESLV